MSGHVEEHLRERLKEVEQVVSVQGRGFLLGLEFADKAASIHKALLDRKIITGTSSDPRVLRLLPPLCLKTGRSRFVCRRTARRFRVIRSAGIAESSAESLSQR